MYFNKATKVSWIVEAIAPPGKRGAQLSPGELAILDRATDRAIDPNSVDWKNNPSVYLAIGSPNSGFGTAGSKHKPIIRDTKNLLMPFRSQRVSMPTKLWTSVPNTESELFTAYLGYNGIDPKTTLKFECGESYAWKVILRGPRIQSLFGGDYHEEVQISTPCCPEDCEPCPESNIECAEPTSLLLEALKNTQYASRFFDFEKVQECDGTGTPTSKECFIHELAICDGGKSSDLAAVQRQYPDLNVWRETRKGGMSYYRVSSDEDTVDLLVDYTIAGGTIATECDTCPDGYTRSAAGIGAIIQIDNDANGKQTDADALSSVDENGLEFFVPADDDFDSASILTAKWLGYDSGVASYYIVVDKATSLQLQPGPNDDTKIISILGDTAGFCIKDDSTDVAWTEVSKSTRISREITLQHFLDDCQIAADADAVVAEAKAFWNGAPGIDVETIEIDTITDCAVIVKAVQWSNCAAPGCDTLADWEFPDLEGDSRSTEGRWEAGEIIYDDTNEPENCLCGIKVTEKPVMTDINECVLTLSEFTGTDGVEMEINRISRHFGDFKECGGFPIDNWQVATHTVPKTLMGYSVFKEVVLYRRYLQQDWYEPKDIFSLKINQLTGINMGVELGAQYAAVHFVHSVTFGHTPTYSNNSNQEHICLYVNNSNMELLEEVKNYVLGWALPAPLFIPAATR